MDGSNVVKLCIQVDYINSSNRMSYHQQNGRGYGHVTVLKLLPLVVMQRVARVCQRLLKVLSYLLNFKITNVHQLGFLNISKYLTVDGINRVNVPVPNFAATGRTVAEI